MILVQVSQLREGMIIAKDVETNSSRTSYIPLVCAGVCVSTALINHLTRHNIEQVYIERAHTEDIVAEDVIERGLKNDALKQIEKIFVDFDKVIKGTSAKAFENVNRVSKQLVESALNNPDVMVSLTNLKQHDDYTYTHSLCVALLSISTGVSMQYDYGTLRDLSTAALLHDVGKVEIPGEILNKPGALSDDEFAVIKTHPAKGREILQKRNSMTSYTILAGIKSHHEKFDGTGYPDQLSQKQIHPFAQIIALSDVYDALTSDRPYHKAGKPNEAVEYIMAYAGTHFDPEIMQHFLQRVVAYPVGSMVELSDGRHAVVVKSYSQNILRPLVRVLNGDAPPQEIDLLHDTQCYNLVITEAL